MADSEDTDVAASATEDWVVVVEAMAATAYQFQEVKELIHLLDCWRATGLYSLERYAVQLHVAATSPYEALTIALTAHDQAVTTMGSNAPTVLRAEVLTLGELKLAGGGTAAEPQEGRVYDALIPAALYDATRALFQARSRSQIYAVLTEFVLVAGGTVNIGELCYFPGQVSVDLGLSSGDDLYATADAASVAGLLIEQFLPSLVDDAWRMLSRLHLADQARQN